MCRNKFVYNKKRPFILFLFVLLGSLFASQHLFAQDEDDSFSPMDSIDFGTIKIPPLQVLFENAKKCPAVDVFRSEIEQKESLLRSEKRKWLHYFKLGASVQYGHFGVNSAFSDEYTPLFYSYSGANQTAYYLSASISVPLDDIFDRKNQVNRARIDVKTAQLSIDRWQEDQKILIIQEYAEVMKQLGVLKKKEEACIYAKALFQTSLNDFKNGNITISELNVANSSQMNTIVSYENTKSSLTSAILRLEVLSQTKIISK